MLRKHLFQFGRNRVRVRLPHRERRFQRVAHFLRVKTVFQFLDNAFQNLVPAHVQNGLLQLCGHTGQRGSVFPVRFIRAGESRIKRAYATPFIHQLIKIAQLLDNRQVAKTLRHGHAHRRIRDIFFVNDF